MIQGAVQAVLVSGRRCICQARSIRVLREQAHQLFYQVADERDIEGTDSGRLEQADGASSEIRGKGSCF